MPDVEEGGMSPRAEDDWDVHWDRFGGAAKGNPAGSYRHRIILSLLPPDGPDIRILDIGSGQGDLAMLLAAGRPQSTIRGLEFSAEGVERARRSAAEQHLRATFTRRDLLAPTLVPMSDRYWATVAICSEVLEHVDAPDVLLRNAKDYLAPGSHLIVTVPGGPRTAFDKYIGHRRHYTEHSLRAVLEQAGFDIKAVYRAGFPFFNLYKLTVLLRGRALISDIDRASQEPAGGVSGLVLAAFNWAFRWNRLSTRFGWQLVALANPSR